MTPTGSRILGVAKRSGSLLGVYEFQNGHLRGSDVGEPRNFTVSLTLNL